MRKMFFMAVSATIILAAAVFCIAQSSDKVLSAFQVPTEAQADTPPSEEEETIDENGGGAWDGWSKGYKQHRVMDFQVVNVTYPPSVQVVFVDCCKKSSQMNACNTQMESPRCKYLTY